MIKKEYLNCWNLQWSGMMFDIMDYDKPYFYGGNLTEEPEVRLIKAIIAQAAVDAQSSDPAIRKSAQEFFESSRFVSCCKLLEGVYL